MPSCSWCSRAVGREEGWRLYERPSGRCAAFCRLEHVVPWAMQGAHWEAGEPREPTGTDTTKTCAYCGAELDEGHVVLVRHRGEHRIPDGFCSVAHLLEWAKAGGRWQ